MTFLKNFEIVFIQKIAATVRFSDMFANCRTFVQQHVEKGVGLCNRHNLHRTDQVRNDKQRNAD